MIAHVHTAGLVQSLGVKEVFVLVTRGELNKYRVPTYLEALGEAGLAVHPHPFPDGQTPPIASLTKMIDALRVNLVQGRKCLLQ